MDKAIFFVFLAHLFCYNKSMIKRIKHLPKNIKIIIFLLVLISGAYVSSWAFGYGQNNNSDGLVLDMTLSSDYYDSGTKTFSDQSGNNNNGVSANSAIFVPDKDGKSEGAMSFNGSSDYVSVSESTLNARSMSLWFYSNSNTEQVIAGGFLGPTYYSLVYIGNKLSIAGDGGASAKVITQNTYSTNTWYHVVVLRTGLSFPNEFRIFVNGVEQSLASGGSHRASGGAIIGARYYSNAFSVFFNGKIENFKAWDRELSVAEIQDLYKQEYVPKIQASSLEKGLVGYWPLDGDHYNSNTNRVTDKSAYSNHGTNYGATLTEDRFGRSEGAMDFNGPNKRIIVPNIRFEADENWSFSIWYNLEATGHNCFNIWSGPRFYNGRLDFYHQQEAPNMNTYFNGYAQYNTWEHLSIVKEGSVIRGYINGEYVGTIDFEDRIYIVEQISRTHSDYGWDGKLSEARVYNRALTESEVKSLYERDAPKISASSLQKGLVLDMPLTSQYTKGGDAVLDKSAYSNNGQNYGSTLNGNYASFSSDLEPLLMNYRLWKDGQTGSIGSFGTYSTGNSRVIAEDPWGKEVVVWESVPNAGIYHSAQAIDNTKLYRMSWWEKRVTNAEATYARYYAGLNGYGSVNGVRNLSNGAYNTNPYFWSANHSSLTEDQWFLVVGHVFPYSHTGTSKHPDSGRYTINGLIGATSADYKWAPETATARSRTLSVYQGNDPGVVHYTVYPRLDVVDGTEPSIQELLNGHDSYGNDIVVTVPGDKTSVSFWYNDATSNGWVHVVNSSGTFYVNGELGTPNKYPIVINGDKVYIGRTSMSDYFVGEISKLKIYNRVLSATEVESLYDQGRGETGIILGGN
jgi:hypothetical protein